MRASRFDESAPLLRKRETPFEATVKVIKWLFPFVILAVGACGLMYFEGWPLLTSLYVIVQIVTTIGYGDFTVHTNGAKLFLSFYTILCLVILAFYMSTAVETILNMEVAFLRKHMRRLEGVSDRDAPDDLRERNKFVATTLLFVTCLAAGVAFYRFAEHCTCSYGIGAIKQCLETDFPTCVATGGRVKGWVEAFYMSVITLTTVGFGDYQPRTYLGRIFGIVWMVMGVGATASFVSILTSKFLEAKKKRHYSNVDVDDINQEIFKQIDRDKSGYLSRGEFMNYTLVKYGLVSQELLEEINLQFDKVDVKRNNKVSYATILDIQSSSARRRHEHP